MTDFAGEMSSSAALTTSVLAQQDSDMPKTALSVLAFVVMVGPAWADGDAKVGAQKIKTFGCIQCHGRDGVSKLAEAPNLAGQVQTYLAAALTSYRSKDRKNELMNTVAEKLTDADIADLAAYYNAIQVAVTPPPKP